MRKPSAAALAAIAEDDGLPPQDKLNALRREVAAVRDLEVTIAELSERLSDAQKKRTETLTKRLPDMFQEIGVKSIGLDAEGNMPPYLAEIQPFYSANIAADWDDERREAALKYMQKMGEGDLIKDVITIEMGRGTSKLRGAVQAALRKLKVPFTSRKTIPHTTLTAWVRERYRQGRPLSDQEKSTLGATIGVVVKLKEKK